MCMCFIDIADGTGQLLAVAVEVAGKLICLHPELLQAVPGMRQAVSHSAIQPCNADCSDMLAKWM